MAEDWLRELHDVAQEAHTRRLRALPYQTYLKSHWWRELRQKALQRSGFACSFCGAEERLQCHHAGGYSRLGTPEELFDLVILCNSCHMSVSPVRRSLKARLLSLSVQKGVEFVPPENLRHAKQLEQELEALPDYRDPRHNAFWKLLDASIHGLVWPSMPFGLLEAIREEQRLRIAALIPLLEPIPRTGKEREWDGVRLASTQRGRRT